MLGFQGVTGSSLALTPGLDRRESFSWKGLLSNDVPPTDTFQRHTHAKPQRRQRKIRRHIPRFGHHLILPIPKRLRIAVVDRYHHSPDDHGQLGQSLLAFYANLFGIPLETVPLSAGWEKVSKKEERSLLHETLPELVKDVEAGRKRFDAINLAMGDEISFEELKEKLGKFINPAIDGALLNKSGFSEPRNPETMNRLKEALVNAMRRFAEAHPHTRFSSQEHHTTEEILKRIDALETLATTHQIPVFIAAGNSGPGTLNLLTLAKNVRSIGGLFPNNDTRWGDSGDNPFVTDWVMCHHEVTHNGRRIPLGPGTSWSTSAAVMAWLVEKLGMVLNIRKAA